MHSDSSVGGTECPSRQDSAFSDAPSNASNEESGKGASTANEIAMEESLVMSLGAAFSPTPERLPDIAMFSVDDDATFFLDGVADDGVAFFFDRADAMAERSPREDHAKSQNARRRPLPTWLRLWGRTPAVPHNLVRSTGFDTVKRENAMDIKVNGSVREEKALGDVRKTAAKAKSTCEAGQGSHRPLREGSNERPPSAGAVGTCKMGISSLFQSWRTSKQHVGEDKCVLGSSIAGGKGDHTQSSNVFACDKEYSWGNAKVRPRHNEGRHFGSVLENSSDKRSQDVNSVLSSTKDDREEASLFKNKRRSLDHMESKRNDDRTPEHPALDEGSGRLLLNCMNASNFVTGLNVAFRPILRPSYGPTGADYLQISKITRRHEGVASSGRKMNQSKKKLRWCIER